MDRKGAIPGGRAKDIHTHTHMQTHTHTYKHHTLTPMHKHTHTHTHTPTLRHKHHTRTNSPMPSPSTHNSCLEVIQSIMQCLLGSRQQTMDVPVVPPLNLIGHGQELIPGSLVNQVLDDLQSIHKLKFLGTHTEGNMVQKRG